MTFNPHQLDLTLDRRSFQNYKTHLSIRRQLTIKSDHRRNTRGAEATIITITSLSGHYWHASPLSVPSPSSLNVTSSPSLPPLRSHLATLSNLITWPFLVRHTRQPDFEGGNYKLCIDNVRDEIWDMVKPGDPFKISLEGLLSCKQGGTVASMLIDVGSFWAHDSRENLLQKEEEQEEERQMSRLKPAVACRPNLDS